MTRPRILGALSVAGVAALALTGCVANTPAGGDALTVTSNDTACEVSAVSTPSGTLAFDVTNEGSQVTEFYLLASDGLRIVGEVENIAPGASRTLTVVAQPGEYFTLCKPGMIGEGVGRAAFTVTGDAVAIDGPDAEQKQQAVNLYAAFVKDQVGQLLPAVQEFATAYESGQDDAARAQQVLGSHAVRANGRGIHQDTGRRTHLRAPFLSGRPASVQPAIPPSRLCSLAKPSFCSFLQAPLLRTPV